MCNSILLIVAIKFFYHAFMGCLIRQMRNGWHRHSPCALSLNKIKERQRKEGRATDHGQWPAYSTYRNNSSNRTAWSVFSSRYLMMMGV